MATYSLTHLSDGTLLRDLAALIARDRANTAQLLAHIAEVDARRLYAPAGYPSMYAYCVGVMHLSEEAAFKRIHAARTARRFPDLFDALAAGRLHLSAVVLLAPHLTEENAAGLLADATHRSKSEIEELLAQRFPRPEVSTRLEPVVSLRAQGSVTEQHAPGRVEAPTSSLVDSLDEGASEPATPRPRVAAWAPARFALQVTIGQATHDKLRKAQALLSHRILRGDLAAVLDRVLDLAIEQLEKKKFRASRKPSGLRSTNPRHVPQSVKAAVWERDGGQCTFVSDCGRRCPAKDPLEFDHVDPVACGGEATVENTRLLCRAHNQYEAERRFGTEFMRRKRDQARKAVARRKADEVIPWLRQLGYTQSEARWRAERCETMPDASIEERVRAALSYVSPKVAFRKPSTPPS
jgi:5-methylcytosine-specific restriction endonuclease McrA